MTRALVMSDYADPDTEIERLNEEIRSWERVADGLAQDLEVQRRIVVEQVAEMARLNDVIARLRAEIAGAQKVVEVVKARIVLMRECAEAALMHLEGLHRAAPARAIREADKALTALAGKPYKEEK